MLNLASELAAVRLLALCSSTSPFGATVVRVFTDLLSFRVSELLNFIRQSMHRGKRCSSCSALNYSFNKQCTSCGVVFSKKDSAVA